MLPNEALSLMPVPASFIPPRGVLRNIAYVNIPPTLPISPQSVGGNGYRDTSTGLDSQVWSGGYSASQLVLAPTVGTPVTVLSGISNIIWFDFCFDQTMNPVLTYSLIDGTSYIYWYNHTTSAFVTTALPAGTDPNVFCQFDDPRPAKSATSDVIVAYTRAAVLYFRASSESYAVEHSLGSTPIAPANILVAVGLNTGLRFQFEFAQPLPPTIAARAIFVPAEVYTTTQIASLGDIRPRIWIPKKNNVVTA